MLRRYPIFASSLQQALIVVPVQALTFCSQVQYTSQESLLRCWLLYCSRARTIFLLYHVFEVPTEQTGQNQNFCFEMIYFLDPVVILVLRIIETQSGKGVEVVALQQKDP